MKTEKQIKNKINYIRRKYNQYEELSPFDEVEIESQLDILNWVLDQDVNLSQEDNL